MQHISGHDRLAFTHRLPEAFQAETLEAHLARGRLLHAHAVRHGFAAAWRRLLHIFDFRLGLTAQHKADQAC